MRLCWSACRRANCSAPIPRITLWWRISEKRLALIDKDLAVKQSMHLGWSGLLIIAALLLTNIAAYPAPPQPNHPVTSTEPVACSSSAGDAMVAFVPVEPMQAAH